MDVNRISGYLPGKMVFFLMQVRARSAVCWLRFENGVVLGWEGSLGLGIQGCRGEGFRDPPVARRGERQRACGLPSGRLPPHGCLV